MNTTEPTAPKTSAAAIWSLVLGILSIVLCLSVFAAIPGLVLGIIAVVNIGKSPQTLSGKGLAIGGIITSAIGLLIMPVMISIALPVFNQIGERSKQMKSVTHVDQIVKGCKLYALDHDDEIPPNLQVLVDEGLIPEEALVSPFDNSDSEGPDYELLLQGRLGDYPDSEPLIRDRFPVSSPSGSQEVVVGFVGGQVEVVEEPASSP